MNFFSFLFTIFGFVGFFLVFFFSWALLASLAGVWLPICMEEVSPCNPYRGLPAPAKVAQAVETIPHIVDVDFLFLANFSGP